MTAHRFLCCLMAVTFVLGAVATAATRSAQDGATAGPGAPPARPARPDPDEVPDEVAIQMLLGGLASATGRRSGVYDAMIAPMGLNRRDQAVLRSQMEYLYELLEEQQARARAANFAVREDPTPENRARAREISTERGTLIAERFERLRQLLSEDGARKLAAHVRRVKREIKPIPGPSVPPPR